MPNQTKKEQISIPVKLLQHSLQVTCYHCGSHDFKKSGKDNTTNKQTYFCKSCSRHFTEGGSLKSKRKHLITITELGIDANEHQKNKWGQEISLDDINQDWLREIVEKYIRYQACNKSLGTIGNYISCFKTFSRFMVINHVYLSGVSQINRSIIIEYLSFLNHEFKSYQRKTHHISTLRLFFETGLINGWFEVNPHLIRLEDYPKHTKSLPRYIPEEVLQKLNQHLATLPEPIMRMVLILQECGLRISELCMLPINCLHENVQGHYSLKVMRWKMKKEDIIPISSELAAVIQEQQKYIQDNLPKDFPYLFCARKPKPSFIPKSEIIRPQNFINFLKYLAQEFDIKDKSGKRWNFQCHQFRHTVGTRMINNGVPQHIIQRYLGHESPNMTMVYAHIHDQTLRKEIEKYHESRVVNFQGETAELDETVLSSNDNLEWFKKNVQARALEHGYCARPKVLGDCDIPGFDGCYNCPHWRTNKNFIPILKDTLERTNNVLEKAQNCGWQLQVYKNTPIKENLEKVIKTLEAEND
ncbi:tyrosine-type recombinase/integrase [Nostoc sp.]|uniref:tyrosine-type recombinase/integrase n=1 Tax=Nostoc sp. TaxID=1180 RepID=UPI002FFBB5EB